MRGATMSVSTATDGMLKELTWEEFMALPVSGNYKRNNIFRVKSGDEIVTFVKHIDRLVDVLRINDGVDYVGCSSSYVLEKVELAINALKWIKQRVKETGK